MKKPPTFDDILSAQQTICKYLSRTPLYRYSGLSELLGCSAFIKHENHQPVGAFKVRGGINFISRLNERERESGVITASTGNHGQSIAWASQLFGVQATIVVPLKSNPDKVNAIRRMGATILEFGKDFDEARVQAEHLSEKNGFCYVHSANEPHLIAGVGTVGMEIIEDLPGVDTIIAPVGGGSCVSGISIAAKAMKPGIEVIAVQSEQAPAAYLSWKAGKPLSTETMRTFAEGLATRVGFEMTVDIMKAHLSDFVLVTDDEIRKAMKLMIEHTHNLVESAGAASLAAAIKIKDRLKNRNVVMVLTGANVTMSTLHEILHD
jgi:threonine dehydratase